MKTDAGFTLVELMVTLAMTAMLTASIYGIFGAQTQRKTVEQETMEMQQNARVAMEMIARDMRMAGFTGCMTPDKFKNVVNGQAGNILLNMSPVGGVNNLSSNNTYGAKEGTDLLVLTFADGDGGIPVDSPYMNSEAADIHLASAGDLREGDIVLVTDCDYTSVFQIIKLNDSGRSCVHNSNEGQGNVQPGNADKDLGHEYGAGSYVYKMAAKYYWVSPQDELKVSSGGYDAGAGAYATGLNEQTIADNIEDLQIQYGVDANNDGRPDQWYAANAVPDWNSVIAAEIFLLAKAGRMEKDYINTHSYSFADHAAPDSDEPANFAYNDQYHRLIERRIVTLRNRTM